MLGESSGASFRIYLKLVWRQPSDGLSKAKGRHVPRQLGALQITQFPHATLSSQLTFRGGLGEQNAQNGSIGASTFYRGLPLILLNDLVHRG